MSGPPNKRRSIRVEGQIEVDDPPAIEYQRVKPRSINEMLGLEKDPEKYEGKPFTADGQPLLSYDPERVRQFIAGNITLGDLEGITKEEQYQVAELGFSSLSSGKLDQAKEIFEGLLALDPFDAYFNLALGSVAHQAEDYPEAEHRYSRALQLNPFSPTAYANRGEIRIMTGRLADGTDDLVKALELDPQAVEPATHRARATIRVLQEKLGGLDRDELERMADKEREELAETEEVVEDALTQAREAERRAAEAAIAAAQAVENGEGDDTTVSPTQVFRRGRAKAKKPKA